MARELATFEAYYSRPIAPTRRIALGRMDLPLEPTPGFGSLLLGGIVARYAPLLDDDVDEEFEGLLDDLEARRHIGQPRLRHRLQQDRVGLARCRHRLIGDGEAVRFAFDTVGTPAQQVIAAAYAAAAIGGRDRGAVFGAIRKGLQWVGPTDDSLVRYLSDLRALSGASRGADPAGWARTKLGVPGAPVGDELKVAVARAFREQLLLAHPDHGGSVALAADRISELREARRILLGQ